MIKWWYLISLPFWISLVSKSLSILMAHTSNTMLSIRGEIEYPLSSWTINWGGTRLWIENSIIFGTRPRSTNIPYHQKIQQPMSIPILLAEKWLSFSTKLQKKIMVTNSSYVVFSRLFIPSVAFSEWVRKIHLSVRGLSSPVPHPTSLTEMS